MIGNDDPFPGVDNNPYTDGRMSSADKMGVAINRAAGNSGDIVEARFHFQEFVRLDLGSKWRQISDDHPWKLNHRVVKFDVSSLGISRWFDFGSNSALDNAGF